MAGLYGLDPESVANESDSVKQMINAAVIDEADRLRSDHQDEAAVQISNARVRSMKG